MAELGRRFPWARYGIVGAVLFLLTVLPLVSVLIAAWLAGANGCRLDEGSVHACMIGGADWGSTLYAMGVMGWLMLVSLPFGGGALLVWLIVLIIHRLAWGRPASPAKERPR